MELSERAEEILEALGIQEESENKTALDLGASRDEPAVEELLKSGFIKIDGNQIVLLEKGRKEAYAAVRRHRLAERLLVDVLDIKKKVIDEVSCRFEHLLHKGLEDNVCRLLGHPKFCPHGKPIPKGDCCREKLKKGPQVVISALCDLKVNQKGKIAYIHTRDDAKLQKLLSMGALPGSSITLNQKFPSYVFSIGHSQFAVDESLAQDIFVRLSALK